MRTDEEIGRGRSMVLVRLALLVEPIYELGLFIGPRLRGVADEVTFRRICQGPCPGLRRPSMQP